jgi:hypothetical protein
MKEFPPFTRSSPRRKPGPIFAPRHEPFFEGKVLRLLGKLGAVEGWVPAFAGMTSNGLRRREARISFLC